MLGRVGLFDETRRGSTTTIHTGGQLGFTWSDGSDFLPDRGDPSRNWGEPTENGGTAVGSDPWMTGAHLLPTAVPPFFDDRRAFGGARCAGRLGWIKSWR